MKTSILIFRTPIRTSQIGKLDLHPIIQQKICSRRSRTLSRRWDSEYKRKMEGSVHQNSDVEFQYYSQTFCTGNRTSNTLLEDSRPWSYLNHRKLGLTCYYLVVISVESNARAQRPQKSRLPFCFCGGKWKSISKAISTLYTSYKPLAQSHAPIWPASFPFF